MRLLICALCLFGCLSLHAQEVLLPEVAFRPSARYIDAMTIEVRYDIAPGHYLYRHKFAFAAPQSAKIGTPVVPRGMVIQDEVFGKVETFRDSVLIRLPAAGSADFLLQATSQGCADIGLCYPPITQALSLKAPRP
jgi:thioredoxin:protein disulfide reductase